MRPPIAGRAGAIWRTATAPARFLAPAVSLAKRVAKAEYWVEAAYELPGPGPVIDMTDEPDIQHPRDGAGLLNHRSYRVHIGDSEMTPVELVDAFRRKPNEFSPTSFATFDPPPGPAGLVVGDKLTVRLPGPWDGPVVVTVSDPQSLLLETRDGHMEAGWIRFGAFADGSETVFEIESIARSGDPAFDFLYHQGRVGKLVQTEMWIRVLEAAVDISGGAMRGRPTVHTNTYQEAGS